MRGCESAGKWYDCKSPTSSLARTVKRSKQNAALSRGVAGSGRLWAPRLAQESRLRQLEDSFARHRVEGEAVEPEIERAVLLGALNRRADAQQAFIDILRRAPANFSALNEFGALLTDMGAIDVAGVVTPRTIAMPRDLLAGADGASSIADRQFTFPLLLRSPGYHTGRNFILVASAAELAAAAVSLPGADLLVIEYLDARGKDGNARKYRVMMIGGQIYPLHLAISRQWKVHYFTSDMADKPDHRLEEASFLGDMPAALGDKAIAALEQIRDALGLDYGGIDFGLGPDGDLLLFEANATMVIVPPNPDERWAYRRAAIGKILDAVVAMIVQKSAQAGRA